MTIPHGGVAGRPKRHDQHRAMACVALELPQRLECWSFNRYHGLTETQMWHQIDPFLGQINRANVSTLIKQRIRMQA